MGYNRVMISFLKKLFNIKNKRPEDFIQVKTPKGEIGVETEDPLLAESIAKVWETGDTVVYENGKMRTISKKSNPKDN